MFFLVFPRLAAEFFLDLIYFPLWWYTGGILYILKTCGDLIKAGNQMLGPGLWLRNLFVPMFGQRDFQGRAVSVLIRFGNFVFRSIGLIMWLMIVFVLLLLWVMVPLLVGYMFILSLGA